MCSHASMRGTCSARLSYRGLKLKLKLKLEPKLSAQNNPGKVVVCCHLQTLLKCYQQHVYLKEIIDSLKYWLMLITSEPKRLLGFY